MVGWTLRKDRRSTEGRLTPHRPPKGQKPQAGKVIRRTRTYQGGNQNDDRNIQKRSRRRNNGQGHHVWRKKPKRWNNLGHLGGYRGKGEQQFKLKVEHRKKKGGNKRPGRCYQEGDTGHYPGHVSCQDAKKNTEPSTLKREGRFTNHLQGWGNRKGKPFSGRRGQKSFRDQGKKTSSVKKPQ